MPAKDLLNRIRKMPGIKAEELEWIGLPEYLEGLAQQGQKVTKDEVLAFVEAGGVKLQEVTKERKIIPVKISSLTREEFNEKWKERYWKLYLEDLLMDRAIKRWDEMSDHKKERYGNSFGNYRLRVLEEGHWTDWLSTEEFETYREELWRNGQDISYDVTYDDSTEYEKYKLPGGENYREVLLTLPQVGDETFRSRHWDEKNVLVHFRLTDRTDESGNKTLLVEEIQSDWHQEGRGKGYKDEAAATAKAAFDTFSQKLAEKYGLNPAQNLAMYATLKGMEPAEVSEYQRLQQEWLKYGDKLVPDAPFKNTDAWAMLAFKRILRMAAEQGYDSVAWTTGEQQAERYDLSKQIDRISYVVDKRLSTFSKKPVTFYNFSAYKDNWMIISKENLTAGELEEYLGKELASKIINSENTTGDFSGLDLKIGGEGMKGFYDKILPAAVQKYLKKLDPSVKVGMKSVKTDDGMVEVHGIKITDAIREAVLAGQPLFQDKRGETRIGPNTSVIELFKIADASTFMHESAHLWLYDMFEYVKSGEADEAYMKDWNVLKDWLKIADDQTDLTVEQQEKFARGFERYLMEGVAPSKGLRKIFATLKRWLIKIYQTADALNVEMTDEVRGVMGRMLTTEAEVEQAQKKTGLYESLITEADVDVDLWQFMDEYRARAHDEAVSQLLKKQMEELEEQRKQALSLEALEQNNAVLEEMFVEPMYAAQYHLHATYGLDVKKTVTAFLDGYLDYDTKEILEHVAERYGFSCAREMAMEIAINPTFEEEQTARLVERLREKGELLTPERLEADAMDAIHNEFQEELIALENVILQEILQNEQAKIQRKVALERARIMTKAARKKAKEILSAKPYNEAAAFKVYYAMERDAAAKAAHYKAKGNKAKAQQYAEERMIAHALAIEAVNNAKEVDKILEYIKPLRMRGRSLLNMPADFVAQIDSLLARFGFIEERPLAPGETVESLSAFCERMAEEYQELPIADIILADRFRKPYTKMTMGELRELYRALKVISVAGRKHNQFFMLFNKANIREAAKEIKQSIESNVGEPYAKDKRPGSKTTLEKILSIPDEIGAWLLKPEFIARFLDGDKDNGPMQRFLIQAFSKAWQEEFQMQQRVIKEMREIIGKFYTEKEMRAMSREREYVPILNKKMTRENLLLFALNLGNDGNKQRLLDGYELSEKQAMEVVDSLTEKDWQLVQAIWDYLDTFWPAIKKLEEEVAGVEPERVEATPIETKYGVFRGGYFPVKYDPEKSSQASKHAEQGKALYAEMPTARAMTKHGHTKQRATKVKRPILLSWKVLSNHLIDVAHDLTHRKAVIDANRLLRNPDVRVAIENAVGVKGFRSLEDSIKAIASGQGEVTTWLDRTFLWMRSRSTLHALGLNLRVALLQLSGINQAMWEIGAIPTLKGIASFATSPKATWDFVKEKSIFMRERAMVFDRDVYAFHRQMFDKDTKLAKFAFYLHAFMDQMWCVPAWAQAYKNALAQGMTEEQAIENADGVIRRAAGSGAEKDLSAAQRGSELQKAFTMFYSFGNLLYNRYWLSMKRTGVLLKQGQGLDAAKQIAGMVAYGWILPGIFEFALREALRSKGDDEEEPEELYKRFGAATLSGPLQTIPLIRDFGSFVINRIFGQYSEYRITPIESAFEEAWRTVEKGREIMEGEGEWTDFAEQAVDTAAYTQGIPKQIVTWIFNALDWFRDFGEADWRDLFSRKHK